MNENMGAEMIRRAVPRPSRRETDSPFAGPPDVKREISYSQKMYDALEERRRLTGVPITEQVRRAIERDLIDAPAVPEPVPDNVIPIELTPSHRQSVDRISRSFGTDAAAFIGHLVRRAISVTPAQLGEFYLGEYFKSGEAARAAEQERQDAIRAKHSPTDEKAA